MKLLPAVIGVVLLTLLASGVWALRFHPQWFQSAPPAEEDQEIDPQKLEVPVHVAPIVQATLHEYVVAIGTAEPAPARPGQMAGTADIAPPVAGVISEVLCQVGQKVARGDPLVQLDDRVARAAEEQADAALAEAKASLAQLKASPRPEQAKIAQLAIDKSRSGVNFAQKNYDRQLELSKQQGTSEKNLEQAALDLASATNELASAEEQLRLLTPTAEELNAQTAKVAQAEAAYRAARTQRELLRITSPIDATVVAVSGNPGDAVDPAKTLVDLVAPQRLFVRVDVPVAQAAPLKDAMPVQILLDTAFVSSVATTQPDPWGSAAAGKVAYIGAEVNRQNGTVPVGIDLDPSVNLVAGQTVRVRIIVSEHKDCLAVPKQSIAADDNGDAFVALVEGQQATHKTVQTGLREGDLVEVKADGLQAGDTVVTAGAYSLSGFQSAHVKVLAD